MYRYVCISKMVQIIPVFHILLHGFGWHIFSELLIISYLPFTTKFENSDFESLHYLPQYDIFQLSFSEIFSMKPKGVYGTP